MSQSSDLASLPAGRPKSIGLHRGAKSLIRNVIRHTDTHNRLLEESEMWQTFNRLKKEKPDETEKTKTAPAETSTSDGTGKDFREPDIRNSFLYDDRKDMRWEGSSRRGLKKAHMDENNDESRQNDASSGKSTFWMRQLQKTEETDADRWGHAGFKELYPDAFDSDRSVASDGRDKKKSKKRTPHTRREHKHKSSVKKKKRKRSESDKVKKKKKKQKKHKDDSDRQKRNKSRRHSDDNDDDSLSDKCEKDRKTRKRKHSTETSESDSESDEESGRKKSRRNMKTESEREKKETREAVTSKSHRKKKKRKH